MARGAVTTEDWDRYPAPPNFFFANGSNFFERKNIFYTNVTDNAKEVAAQRQSENRKPFYSKNKLPLQAFLEHSAESEGNKTYKQMVRHPAEILIVYMNRALGHRGLDATSSDPCELSKNVSLTDREGRTEEYEIRAAIRKKGLKKY